MPLKMINSFSSSVRVILASMFLYLMHKMCKCISIFNLHRLAEDSDVSAPEFSQSNDVICQTNPGRSSEI